MLGEISITGEGHLLFSKDILGYTIEQAKKFISGIITESAIYEDCTWGKAETSGLLHLEGFGLMILFKSGVLDELVCSYLFENDNETIIWPNPQGGTVSWISEALSDILSWTGNVTPFLN